MNRPYLVVDLEATCDQPESFPRSESEIIEIGAVLVDAATLAPKDEFQTFVRPVWHATLTPFCTRLTTITQAQVTHAPMLRAALAALGRWLTGPVTLASWGAYDRNQLRRETDRKRIRLPWDHQHLNIKEAFGQRTGGAMGVGQALGRLGLRFEGTPHRGIDDARNIVRIMPYALGRAPLPATAGPRGGEARQSSMAKRP